MLVLSRRVGQQIQIGDHIVVTVLRLQGNTVRLGIQATDETQILRRELDIPVGPQDAKAPAAART